MSDKFDIKFISIWRTYEIMQYCYKFLFDNDDDNVNSGNSGNSGNNSNDQVISCIEHMKVDTNNNYDKDLLQAIIHHIRDERQLAITHYKLAIVNSSCIHSMINLALYISNNIREANDEAFNYLQLAVTTASSLSLQQTQQTENNILQGWAKYNLACYYKDINKNYEVASGAFYEAFKCGYIFAIYDLALMTYINLKDYHKVIEYYHIANERGLCDKVPAKLHIYFYLGHCYEQLDDIPNAKKYYLIDIELNNGNNYRSLTHIANVYYKQHEFREAVKCWKLCVTGFDCTESLDTIIQYYIGSNKKCVLKRYLKMLVTKHNNRYAITKLGSHCIKHGNYQQAIHYLVMDINNVDNLMMLATYYADNKQYEVAINYYKMATALGSVIAMGHIGCIYATLDNLGQAILCYQTVIDNKHKLVNDSDSDSDNNSDSNQHNYFFAIANHDIACCYQKLKQYEIALDYSLVAVEYGCKNGVDAIIICLSNIKQINRYHIDKITNIIYALDSVDSQMKSDLAHQLIRYIINNSLYYNNTHDSDEVMSIIVDAITLVYDPQITIRKVFKDAILDWIRTNYGFEKWFNRTLPIIKVKCKSDTRHCTLNHDCPICLCDNIDYGITLICKHQYCYSCLSIYCKNNYMCPLCRNFIC